MSEENNNLETNPTVMDESAQPVVEPINEPTPEPVVEEVAPIIEPVIEPIIEPVVETVDTIEENKPAENLITATSFSSNESGVPAMGVIADGIIASTMVNPAPKKNTSVKNTVKEETVAIYSTKNVSWSGAGKVYRGYNFVTKSAAEKWLTRDHIRLATPEEVAKEFGK